MTWAAFSLAGEPVASGIAAVSGGDTSGTLSGDGILPTVLAIGSFGAVPAELSGAAILPTVQAVGEFGGTRILGSLVGSVRRRHPVRIN